jgi:hypothetical protein
MKSIPQLLNSYLFSFYIRLDANPENRIYGIANICLKKNGVA